MSAVQNAVATQLMAARQQEGVDSKALREEISTNLNAFRQSTAQTITDIAGLQKQQVDFFSTQLSKLTVTNEAKLECLR